MTRSVHVEVEIRELDPKRTGHLEAAARIPNLTKELAAAKGGCSAVSPGACEPMSSEAAGAPPDELPST